MAKPLIAANLRFVLVGGHAINAWTGEARATVDIDIIAERPARARDALHAAFPHLTVEEHPVVIRMKDAAMEAIAIIRPESSPFFKRVLKFTQSVRLGEVDMQIPRQEAALALKFAALVMRTRRLEDRYVDARDFILVAKSIATPDEQTLAELGELAFTGGGNEILKLLADARAGDGWSSSRPSARGSSYTSQCLFRPSCFPTTTSPPAATSAASTTASS
ncbi:MAG: nucleotidyl transferase AbiEii/AbiGii toxin family protein [Planctomycetota bacterium]|nr:nucleotidyl transferase AbiEii/AbiGii toxin family protein [Planctomycetota bacterium]